MNNKIVKYISSVLFILLFFVVFIYGDKVKISVINTSLVFIKDIFPILFISSIIIKLLNTSFIINLFKSNLKLYVFFISLISGAPSNAILFKDLLDKKVINNKSVSLLIAVTTINNPLFIYSMLKILCNNPFKLFISIYLLNIISFIMLYKKIEIKPFKIDINDNLGFIIKDCINNMLIIYGTIVFFKLIVDLFISSNSLYECFFSGLIEVTSGLICLSNISIITLKKELLSFVILLFGSFSIHNQVSNILPKDIDYKYMYIIKILQIFMGIFFLFHM